MFVLKERDAGAGFSGGGVFKKVAAK